MKRLLIACVMVLFSVSIASAEWIVDFRDTYSAEGIDKAVENALKDGKNPEIIVEIGLEIEGLNPQNLVRALYCAGASGQDIRAAAEKWQIAEPIIAAGYKKSIDECGDRVADSQAYTPVGTGPSFATPRGGRNGSYASESTFR
ncbi:MAG: hypothetical protein KJ630_01475 [Proteobacteria bacterium]|nr:hypothetical protein [Pseudomonadota bacterium]